MLSRALGIVTAILMLTAAWGWTDALASSDAAVRHAPARAPDEGKGPFERLIIRGVTVIDGTGAPAVGPMDVVIEDDRIVEVKGVGSPLGGIAADERPDQGTREIDAEGMYVLPGFVDTHGHVGGAPQGTPAEYVYKLWLGHGITTVRDPGARNGVEWTLRARRKSADNDIVAPHLSVYSFIGQGWDEGDVDSPEKAREWVEWAADKGLDGIKLRNVYARDIAIALLEAAREHELGIAAHLTQRGVARFDALQAARHGLTSLEHWYGLPEALFDDRTVQHFPAEYNYANEYHRFARAGRLWRQAAEPGGESWRAVMEELLSEQLYLNPTLTIYEANRDVMRARNAPWHESYTLASLWEFFQPSPQSHGSYWFNWTTADEIAWKHNFRRWMRFLNEYKNRGGSVCTGSDSGFIYKLYGFGYIRELELLQEAGFHPLEVVRAATLCGAEQIAAPEGKEPLFGVVKPGKRADLLLVEQNPIEDFKVLYGTGTQRYNDDTGQVEQVGGVRYTIKDGIVYDARELLRDVREMVNEAELAKQ